MRALVLFSLLSTLAACGGEIDRPPDPSALPPAAEVSPAACVTAEDAFVCGDGLPVGVTVQFLDGDGGIARGCTLAGGGSPSCALGEPCVAILAPDGRTSAGRCEDVLRP